MNWEKNVKKIAKAVVENNIKSVIFSQIVDGWVDVIKLIKDLNPSIKIKVSKGPETAELPKLEGLSIEDARKTAEGLGITLKEETENSDKVQEGIVIRQDTRSELGPICFLCQN